MTVGEVEAQEESEYGSFRHLSASHQTEPLANGLIRIARDISLFARNLKTHAMNADAEHAARDVRLKAFESLLESRERILASSEAICRTLAAELRYSRATLAKTEAKCAVLHSLLLAKDVPDAEILEIMAKVDQQAAVNREEADSYNKAFLHSLTLETHEKEEEEDLKEVVEPTEDLIQGTFNKQLQALMAEAEADDEEILKTKDDYLQQLLSKFDEQMESISRMPGRYTNAASDIAKQLALEVNMVYRIED